MTRWILPIHFCGIRVLKSLELKMLKSNIKIISGFCKMSYEDKVHTPYTLLRYLASKKVS